LTRDVLLLSALGYSRVAHTGYNRRLSSFQPQVIVEMRLEDVAKNTAAGQHTRSKGAITRGIACVHYIFATRCPGSTISSLLHLNLNRACHMCLYRICSKMLCCSILESLCTPRCGSGREESGFTTRMDKRTTAKLEDDHRMACCATDWWEYDPKSSKEKKYIQQRGFASGHPPDY
jgi:hypothetical protein